MLLTSGQVQHVDAAVDATHSDGLPGRVPCTGEQAALQHRQGPLQLGARLPALDAKQADAAVIAGRGKQVGVTWGHEDLHRWGIRNFEILFNQLHYLINPLSHLP